VFSNLFSVIKIPKLDNSMIHLHFKLKYTIISIRNS